MYKAKYVKTGASKRRSNKKAVTLLISLLLLTSLVIGGTLAALIDDTDPVVNEFTPSKVGSSVDEEFNGTVKKNVNVTNTGDIAAYVRVRLVTYRVNDQGQRIGGEAAIPAFTPGTGWVKNGDYYYYTSPVAPGAKPDANLIDQITLLSYNDADGGKQVIEVMAEAIQADGMVDGVKAVVKAWGIDPEKLK